MIIDYTDDESKIDEYEKLLGNFSIVWAYSNDRRALALEKYLPNYFSPSHYQTVPGRCRWRFIDGSLDIDGFDDSRPNLTIGEDDLEKVYNNSFTRSYKEAVKWAMSMQYCLILNNNLADQVLDLLSVLGEKRDILEEITARTAFKMLT